MMARVHESESWLAEVSPDDMRRIVDALYRVHSLVSLITDLNKLLEAIIEESKQLASAQGASLLLFDEPSQELYFHVALGDGGASQVLKTDIRLRLGEGIAGTTAETRASVNIANAPDDPRFYPKADAMTQFETRSLLAVPMLDKDSLVGVLEVVNKVDGDAFTDVDRHVMEIFASLAATVIANARLVEENLRAERLAATGEAVAGLSHYTKNIIGGLIGSVDLIDHGIERDDLTVLKKGWTVMKRSLDRISNVVEDMLAYSKSRKPFRESCDVAEILADAAQSFEGVLAGKDVVLTIDADGVQGPVALDARGMHRCLLNLLTNAGDAVPKTGGRIEIRAWDSEDGALKIEVVDNGPGVPEAIIPNLFDPFFSTKGSGGTGLGLAVTKKIITEHGGTIAVTRASGGGARFCLTLPSQA